MNITPAHRQDAASKGYTLQTYANGFGVWHCKITFPNGAGNTEEGVRLIENAKRSARRAIRHEILIRERNGFQLKRLSYEIASNASFSSGALAQLTIREA